MSHEITFIRHAQSFHNVASIGYKLQHGLPSSWEVLRECPGFLSEVKYSNRLLDAKITEKGVEQCLKARQLTADYTPDVVLVSPLNRTLETCKQIFGGRNLKIVVEPLLAEAFRSACDYGEPLGLKMEKYPEFDFTNVIRDGDLWFLENESAENKQKYLERIVSEGAETHEEKCQVMLSFMKESFIFEEPLTVRKRVSRIKKLLDKYSQKNEKIVVVSHFNTINCTVAKEFDQNHYPIDSPEVDNCEIYRTTLEELLKEKQ